MPKLTPQKLLLAILAVATVSSAQVSVTTSHNDLARTGLNSQETVLNTSDVNVASFGKLFSRSVDAQIYAQPLYLPGVVIPGQGAHNVVYVATEGNSVYAFDADLPSASTPLWHVNLGTPVQSSVIGVIRNILPQIGITSTPVIDTASSTIYIVAETYENSQAVFRLHALDLTTGAEKFNGPVVIQGSVQGNGYDAVSGTVTFKPVMHWQRPGLLLWGGKVYIGFGSHQDDDPYHGWIFGYDATTLAQTAIYCTTPNGEEGGVWQGGIGLALDSSTGYMYVSTGNGTFNANTGLSDYGDSILKLDTSNHLTPLDYFAPSNQAALLNSDVDLGAAGVLLIPGTNLSVAGGKNGTMYLLNRSNLGQYNTAADQVVQEWQATFSFLQTNAAGFFGGPVFYNSQLYVWGRRDTLKQFAFNGSTFNTTPIQGTTTIPNGYSDEPAMSVSSNGTAAGSGILWATYATSADDGGGLPLPGILTALDAANVTHELWNSNQNQARDSSGSWSKWNPPTIANGKVYLATFDNVLNVYGLLSGGSGSLTGVGDSSSSAVNLTTEGGADWVHFGDGTLNRKAGVSAQLSTYTTVPAGLAPSTYGNDPRPMSWTDGTPTGSSPTNTNGLFISSIGHGFSVQAPADTTTRTLVLHVGGFASGGTLTAHLSDGSAANFTDVTTSVAGQFDRNYTLTYHAGAAGQTLTVTWVMTSGSGNVTLNAVALAGTSAPAITASGGTPQSTTEGAAFPNALQATVTNGGNPVSGVSVKFTAPGSGAGGTFTGGVTTVNVTTSSNGIAAAPAFTANSTAGAYSVTASATGVPGTATFSLTNTAGTAANIAATAGNSQTATVSTAFATALQATVTDNGGNPVSGVSVKFQAPISGASGTFTGGVTTVNISTGGNGIATAPTFTANSTAGAYSVTASVSGIAGTANFSLTNAVSTGSGSLLGTGTSSTSAVNLTAEGTADWVHWGDTSLNRKSGVAAQLSTYTTIPSGAPGIYANDLRPMSWTDGTPTTSSANNANGVYVWNTGSGFSIQAPADTTIRTLLVHVGGWASGGTLTARLSDASAPNYTDITAMNGGQYDRNYTLVYSASRSGQVLTVTWVMSSGTGNVTLNAAALSGAAGSTISASAGTPQTTTEGTAFAAAMQATVSNGGAGVGGVTVTFTAPSSGASGTFAGGLTAASVTTASTGVATAPTFTANSLLGSYTVTASVAGAASPANFSLTNTTGTAANVAATAGNSQSAVINAAFATALKATVTDSGGNAVGGVTVTFTAPSSGASGTFTGGLTTVSVTTGSNGVATAPTFTANSKSGTYSVTGRVTGVALPASYTLTNLVGPAANVAATAGSAQSTTVSTAFPAGLQATVTDSGGNAVSGVTVTFTAPSSGASGTFTGGLTTASVTTASTGVAAAPAFTANSQTGTYNVIASVTGVASSASFNLTNLTNTAVFHSGWYSTAWNWRKPITINHALVSGSSSLAGFPLLFSVTDPNLATVANGGGTGKADGTDILFTASDGVTKLNHEVESYNATTGNLTAWVQVPSLSPAADTSIYVYYGNSSAPDQQNKAGLWSPGFIGVYHLAEHAVNTLVVDSTGAHNGAATENTISTTTSGEIGSASLFNGSTDYVTVFQAGSFNLDAHPFTVETWLKDDSPPSSLDTFHRIISWNDGTNNIQLGLGQDATATQRSFYLMNSPNSALPNVVSSGNAPLGFNHVVVTFDGSSSYHVYLNGVNSDGGSLKSGAVTALLGNTTTLFLGQRGDGTTATFIDGVLDEVRISNTALSSAWINAEFRNQSSPAAFVSTGAAQGQPTSGAIAVSGGTPQTTTEGTAFATALQAAVTDSGGNPMSGVSVKFQAPTSGASGTFMGGVATVNITTGANGIATAPVFTANGTAGAYSVTASATGVSGTANFSLTNAAGSAANIAASAGSSQSATVGTAFAIVLQATITDSGGNPVSGVSVKFTAPTSGASGTFAGGVTTVNITTGSNGIASTSIFTANGTAGTYSVTGSVAGVASTANFSLTNTAVTGSGSLSGAGVSSTTAVNLTTVGTVDWIHWGDGSVNRKAGVTPQLSTYATVPGGNAGTYTNDRRPMSWTDGTTTVSSSNNTNGVFIWSVGQGFSITAPADTTTRTLVVYAGGWASGGTLTARLSDGSAANFTDVTAMSGNQYDRTYTLTYSASKSAQTLTVTWIQSSGTGNVTLNAAALH